MSLMVDIVMFGWPLVVWGLLAALPTRRAVMAAYILGVLFLPAAAQGAQAVYKFKGLPDYSRISATSLILLPSVLLLDSGTVLRFRPRLIDLFMLVYCVAPLASSLSNGLGWYDGISQMRDETIRWGIPYLMGRLYLTTVAAHRELAIGILIGALVYVPLCLIEIRLSPQLNTWVYGYAQHMFAQTMRFGGYRPVVFMEHGLAVGLFMGAACLIVVWLWFTGSARRVLGMPIQAVAPVLLGTFVLCKSMGALAEYAVATGLLFAARWLRMRSILLLLAAFPLLYVTDRIANLGVAEAIEQTAAMVQQERADSLRFRLDNEAALIRKAMEQPLLGWGGWGRGRVHDEEGRDLSVTDGLWIIVFGNQGLVGLVGLLGFQLLPAVALIRRIRSGGLGAAEAAAPLALAMCLLMFSVDALLNAPTNAVFMLMAGGLVSLSGSVRPKRRAPARRREQEPLHWRMRTMAAKDEGRDEGPGPDEPMTLPGER